MKKTTIYTVLCTTIIASSNSWAMDQVKDLTAAGDAPLTPLTLKKQSIEEDLRKLKTEEEALPELEKKMCTNLVKIFHQCQLK